MTHKTILIKINFEINEMQKTISELVGIVYLFKDIKFYLCIDEKYVTNFKQHFVLFNNVKIIKQAKNLNLSTKRDNYLQKNQLNKQIIDGYEIANGIYRYQGLFIDSYNILKKINSYEKEIFYYIGDHLLNFINFDSGKFILSKMYQDLCELDMHQRTKLHIVYQPFMYEPDGQLSITNEYINYAIKVIRSFFVNHYNVSINVLLDAYITNENVLSFCVTNNIDGFVYNWNSDNVDLLFDFIRKVYGWQSIIINQLRRRLLP